MNASYLHRRRSWLWLSALLLIVGLAFPTSAAAQPEMTSNSYVIQLGNFNMTSGEKSGGGYTVTDTVGQTAPGEYAGTGYKVLAGFQYIYGAGQEFTLRILNLSVPLGELAINQFSENSHELVVNSPFSGFAILARADHELRLPGGSTAPVIAHTNCDTSCSPTAAGEWTNASNHGFGFHVSGQYAASDFINNTYFRPFADAEDGQSSQLIAQHDSVVRDEVFTVSYRVAIGGSQAAGNYQTTIDYTAIPSY